MTNAALRRTGGAQEKLFDTALTMIGAVSRLPGVRVDREQFLRQQFAGSPHLDRILEHGPQSVFTTAALRKKAHRVVRRNTRNTVVTSFMAGLPANPVIMVPAGGADVAQYFGFAVRTAQQIAYVFGEDDLFHGDGEISEAAKLRIVAYLGGMFGVDGAAALIAHTSEIPGAVAGPAGAKAAGRPLTDTVWYPVLRRTGALIGKKVTRTGMEKTATKMVPGLGGVVSAWMTYTAFRPMGRRLTDVFVRSLDGGFDGVGLDPAFRVTG